MRKNTLFSSPRFTSTLLAATAMTLVSASVWADDNFANISQSGSGNSSVVMQAAGDLNNLGTSANAASQNGVGNSIDLDQTGNGNQVGTRGTGLDQTGNGNLLVIDQFSDGNRVNQISQNSGIGSRTLNSATVIQQTASGEPVDGRSTVTNISQTHVSGDVNNVAITQTSQGAGGNIIGTGDAESVSGGVTQIGGGNDADLRQAGEGNRIGTLLQDGEGNEIAMRQDGNGNRIDGSQVGNGNVAEASQVGNLNGTLGFGSFVGSASSVTQGLIAQEGDGNVARLGLLGDNNRFGIDQSGDWNEALARAEGNTNDLALSQTGIGNFGEVLIGDRVPGSDGNQTVLNQDAGSLAYGNEGQILVDGNTNSVSINQVAGISYNIGLVDIQGDQNTVAVDQIGSNRGDVYFTGNGNNATLNQNGLINSTLITSVGDNNQFAIDQYGDWNDVLVQANGNANDVTLSQTGDVNSGLIAQEGDGNVARLGLLGDNNRFGIDQSGDWNEALARAEGNTNDLALSQTGIGNFGEVLIGDRVPGSDGNQTVLNQDAGSLAYGNEGQILVDGNTNSVSINQVAGISYNIGLVDIQGDQNTVGVDQIGSNRGDVYVTGNGNNATLNQNGLINSALITSVGDNNQFAIDQYGDWNDVLVQANGNANDVTLSQTGDLNSGELYLVGDSNTVSLNQDGSSGENSLTAAITGNSNVLNVSQTNPSLFDDMNSITIDIYGNSNNSAGAFSTGWSSAAVAGGLLMPGDLVQSGSGNTIALQVGSALVPSSDLNQFAFAQLGEGNTIDGSITGTGNEVAIVQTGNGNYSAFTQVGSGNSIGISQ
ncbi:hypothetical protein AAIB41_00005 [Brucella sp. BE17]|uniref:beta strand repeat-containing protein n=1 Tax=Brucella sp. BE17 TaxID=3142977 RepID=UPI0031BB5339